MKPMQPPRRARKSRGSERGATLVIVVLLMAALMSIGLFAARAANVANAASGYTRQSSQTHYVTEYGMLAVVAELSGPRRSWYMNQMTTPDPGCTTLTKDSSGNLLPNATCYRFGYSDLQNNLLSGVTGKQLVEPTGLGAGGQISDFVVEMGDRAPANEAVAGMARSGDMGQVNMKFWNVTLTAIGEVYQPLAGNSASTTATTETMRFHLTVGPF